MARLFDDASSQFLENANAVVTAAPVTLACWFYSDDATIAQTLLSIGNAGTANDYFDIRANGNLAGDPIRAFTAGSGVSSNAATTTGYSANTWHHACGVFASAASRAVYIDGGSKGTETTSRTPVGLSTTAIGRLATSSATKNYFSGRIAEAAIWNVALSDAEVAALARGISPLYVQPTALVAYWPIWGQASPEIDLTVGNRQMTVTGATLAPHAPVAPRKIWTPTRFDIPALDLLYGLVAHWKLDEASGTRNDSHGTNHLIDSNTVTQTAGKIGSAAQFTRVNSEELSLLDNPAISTGSIDFTFAFWLNPDTLPSYGILSKWSSDSAQREYCIYYNAVTANRLSFGCSNGTSEAHVIANSFGAMTPGAWHFVIVWHDSLADTLNIQVNNGPVDSLAYTLGVVDSTSTFYLGRDQTGTNFYDGAMDSVSFWKRVLSSGERMSLWNGGVGLDYPFTGAARAMMHYLRTRAA